MKIVFLMNSFYELNTGGAEYQAYMIAKELATKKHDISFIFTQNKNDQCQNKNRFKLYPIQKTRFFKLHLLKLIYFFKAYQHLKAVQPDIIYHRTFSSFLLLAHWYRFLHRNVKIILHISHDEDVQRLIIWFEKSRIVKSIDDFFRYIGLFFTKNIIVQSSYQQQLLLKNHNCKSVVIRNFCEVAEKKNINIKENIIVWIANVKPIKNPFEFIDLANDLKGNNYRFLMIGKPIGGKFRNQFYEALENSNVEYFGALTNKDVNSILCRSKILCCTSYGEGFSNTFLQAWIRRVPVVSLYVDPDDLIKKCKLGLHSKSYDKLKNDITSLIENPSELESMADRVKNFAEIFFLIQNNFYKFNDYLNRLK
ncbi:MAG: hypothetical protein C0412_07950 [Flavobacterium sp.]|nr:hypothetical protein [Flavobacterium sp.]